MKKEQLIELEDACVVVRPAEGEPQIKQMMPLTKIGALSGGSSGALWGALVGLLFLNPLAGMAIGAGVGAATGALAGRLSDYGINDDFIKDLGSKIQPNTSALFLLIRKVTADKVLERLKAEGFHGHVLQTNLTNEQEQGPAQGDRRRGRRHRLTLRRRGWNHRRRRPVCSRSTTVGRGLMASLGELREQARNCRNCHLWEPATQTVFGEGPAERAILFVGEQPGDQEDLRAGRSSGRPGSCSTRAGRGGHRPAAGLRHQRGQALQVRAARQAAHPPEARLQGGAGLQALADWRARRGARRRPWSPWVRQQRSRCSGAAVTIGRERADSNPTRPTGICSSPSTPPTCCACPTSAPGPRNIAASSRSSV